MHSLLAPAKINLTLEVLGELPGGYHELDTVFASLDLADELRWREATQTRLTLSGELRGLPISSGEDNLVLRALRALESRVGRELPLEIELIKRIPAGGGLGGGSVDAAALLWGANQSHQLGLSPLELQQLGATLGADVAYGVRGGVAGGRGRGDELEPLPVPRSQTVHLILPPFACPTGDVYRAWDARPVPQAPGCSARLVAELQTDTPLALEHLANDLESAAWQVQPALADISQALRPLGRVLLCGSGSTLSCWSEASTAEVERRVRAWNCQVVTTHLGGGPRQ